MARNRIVWIVLLGAAFWLGRTARDGVLPLAPLPVEAGETLRVPEGEHFVSTDGGNAYLWRREGNRIVLVNHCKVLDSAEGQAAYVSVPGVERGS